MDRLTGAVTELGVEKKENFYYEIDEMIHQVERGEIESKSVPFKTSLTVHEVLTEVRRQSGIVFPQDKKQGA